MPALTDRPERAIRLFNRKVVPLFSDLLLHDVGTGDGIRQAAADGAGDPDAGAVGCCACGGRCCTTARASTIEDAIGLHTDEALRRERGSWRCPPSNERR